MITIFKVHMVENDHIRVNMVEIHYIYPFSEYGGWPPYSQICLIWWKSNIFTVSFIRSFTTLLVMQGSIQTFVCLVDFHFGTKAQRVVLFLV